LSQKPDRIETWVCLRVAEGENDLEKKLGPQRVKQSIVGFFNY